MLSDVLDAATASDGEIDNAGTDESAVPHLSELDQGGVNANDSFTTRPGMPPSLILLICI